MSCQKCKETYDSIPDFSGESKPCPACQIQWVKITQSEKLNREAMDFMDQMGFYEKDKDPVKDLDRMLSRDFVVSGWPMISEIATYEQLLKLKARASSKRQSLFLTLLNHFRALGLGVTVTGGLPPPCEPEPTPV